MKLCCPVVEGISSSSVDDDDDDDDEEYQTETAIANSH